MGIKEKKLVREVMEICESCRHGKACVMALSDDIFCQNGNTNCPGYREIGYSYDPMIRFCQKSLFTIDMVTYKKYSRLVNSIFET